jgi:hypothetical protein
MPKVIVYPYTQVILFCTFCIVRLLPRPPQRENKRHCLAGTCWWVAANGGCQKKQRPLIIAVSASTTLDLFLPALPFHEHLDLSQVVQSEGKATIEIRDLACFNCFTKTLFPSPKSKHHQGFPPHCFPTKDLPPLLVPHPLALVGYRQRLSL